MNTIIIILSIITVLIVSIPLIFKLVLTKIVGLSIARIKIRSPLCWINLLCHLKLDHWAIKHLTIHIPKITISFNLSPMKIVLQAQNLQIFLGRRILPLNCVNLIDGAQQSAILSNLDAQILKCLKNNFLKSFKKPSYQQNKNKNSTEENKLKLIVNAFIYFFLVIALQFIEVKINNTEICLVSHIPQKQIDFKQPEQTRKVLILMQCLSQYTVIIPDIFLKINIKNGHQQQFQINSGDIKIFTYSHIQQQICIIQGLKFFITLPFNFSLQQSLRKLSLQWNIRKVKFNTVPQDFQDIAQLIKQLLFDPNYETIQQFQDENDNKQLAISLSLKIQNIQLTLKSLYEPDHDDVCNFEYLTNIQSSTLRFKDIFLNKKGFNIAEVRLLICKGINLEDATKNVQQQGINNKIQSLIQKIIENREYHVLRIPNISINNYESGNRIQIHHNQVQVICEKQELALLGKLFRIINSRTKFQQYQWPIYLPYVNIVEQYHIGQISIIEMISKSLFVSKESLSINITSNIKQVSQLKPKNQRIVTYSPQAVYINLHINKLTHKCVLPSLKYTQQQSKDTVNHQLFMQKILIQYKNIKEFLINDFKLLYNETGDNQSLSIFIDDIIMVQNHKTLIQYLVGFTLFKSLLQLNSPSLQIQEPRGNGKRADKIVQIKKIVLNYASQTATARTLLIKKQTASNGYLENLNFSLAKCDLQLNNIVQNKKKLLYSVPNIHTLFSFEKLSLTMFLVKVDKALKQKTQIHLKSPSFIVPQVNISQRVTDYIQTLKSLQIYIQAYMKNVTDQKLKSIKHRLSSLIQQPDLLILKVTDLVLAAQDTLFDIALLNHGRLIRQYLSKNKKINQAQVISEINHKKKCFKLFQIYLASFTLQYQPIKKLLQSQEGVVSWIQQNLNYQKNDGRLSKVNAFRLKTQMKDLSLRIRDYPMNIIKLDTLLMDVQFLDTLNVYLDEQYFVKMKATLGKLEINIGLNLLSGIIQVAKKINLYFDSIQGKISSNQKSLKFQELNQVSKKQLQTQNNIHPLLLQKTSDPYWKVLHQLIKWNATIQKPTDTRVTILTDSHPYSLDGFEVNIGKISAFSHLQATKFQIDRMNVSYPWGNKLVNILQLYDLGGTFKSIYNQPYLKVLTQCNIGSKRFQKEEKQSSSMIKQPVVNESVVNEKSAQQKMVEVKKSNKINRLLLSKNLIQYLSKMKQLRSDWLTIYGLVQNNDQDDQQNEVVSARLNYLQIANIAANKSLKKGNKQQSLMSVLKSVQWKFLLTQLQVRLSNNNSRSLSLFTDNLNLSAKVAPDSQAQSWNLIYFRARLSQAIARVIKGQQNIEKFIQDYEKLSNCTDLRKTIKQCDSLKQTFFVGRKIKFTARAYLQQKPEIFYVAKLFQCDSLKGQLSIELKKTLQNLINDIIINSDLIVPQKAIKKAQYKKQRFRKAVKLVMRVNRKKKKKIPSFDIAFKVKNISVALKTDKKQVILGSKKDTLLKLSKIYDRQDKYHIDPKRQLGLSFQDLQMWIQTVNNQWVFQHHQNREGIKIVSSNNLTFQTLIYVHDQMPTYVRRFSNTKMQNKDRINSIFCLFQTGIVHLTSETSDMLREIVQFIIQMADPSARKQKVQKIDSQKYFQLISKGKDQLKNKLQWVYSDVNKKSKHLKAKFNFQLEDMNILLQKPQSEAHQMFMKIQSSKIQLKYCIFQNGKQQKRLQVNDLLVVNTMQDLNSPYRNILQMNSKQKQAVIILAQTYQLPCFYDKVLWDLYPQLRIHFNPLKFKITQEAVQQIQKFFFGINKGQQNNQQQEQQFKYSNKIPDYFKTLIIQQVKVQVWYRTQSVIKRMDGISVGLEKFQKEKWFVSRKQMFDSFIKFVLKQLAGQFFNVIGQKLFG